MKLFNLKQLVSIDYVPSKKMDLVYIPERKKTIKEGKWYQKKTYKEVIEREAGYGTSYLLGFMYDSDLVKKFMDVWVKDIEISNNYPYIEKIIDENLNRRFLIKKSHIVFTFSNNDKEILYFNTRREAKWYISTFMLRNKNLSKTLKQLKFEDSDYDYTE